MKRAIFILFLAVMTVFTGCKKMGKSEGSINLFPEMEKGKVVAEFDGVKITDKYLEAYMGQLNPYIKARYNTKEKKKEFVEKIVKGELLARYAVKKGLVDNPMLLTKVKSNIARFYVTDTLKKDMEENMKVPDAEMKKYYEENKSEFNKPAKVKASHILIKVAKDAKDKNAAYSKAKKKADKVYREIKAKQKSPGIFKKLTKKYSDDPGSAKRGGNVGYFAKKEEGGRMVKAFADVAFALEKVGDISKPVKSEFGYHVIKLTGRRDAVEKTFEEVKNRVESKLKREKRKDYFENHVAKIEKELGYVFHDENLSALDFSSPAGKKPRRGNPLQNAVRNKMKNKGKIKNLKKSIKNAEKALKKNAQQKKKMKKKPAAEKK